MRNLPSLPPGDPPADLNGFAASAEAPAGGQLKLARASLRNLWLRLRGPRLGQGAFASGPESSRSPALHLRAGLATVLTAGVLLALLEVRAGLHLRHLAPRLARLNLPDGTHSLLLQRQLFLLPHCVPVYGSSELSIVQPTRPDLFFHRRNQGFDVALIGQAGDRCLIMTQELAALGDAARGKKLVVFLSPVWFLPPPESERRDHSLHNQFAGTFSPLQMGECALAGTLPRPLRRKIATRLLDYAQIIKTRSPLLHCTLTNLAAGTASREIMFEVLTPLLGLQNAVLKWQERYHWLELAQNRVAMRLPGSYYRSRRKHEDWQELLQTVDRMEAKTQESTFYSRGFAPRASNAEISAAERPKLRPDRDEEFLRRMRAAPEWTDLELLLRTAKTLGVRLLLVDQPINGLYSDREGVTPAARREYYDRVSQLAAAHRVPLRDFSAHEEDRTFFTDLVHPSAKAWVYYDQALDEFYHHKHD